jgi:hypothetical protein
MVTRFKHILAGSIVPPDTPILVQGYETGWDAIHTVKQTSVVPYRRAQDWDGEFMEAAECSQTGTAALVIVGRRDVHRR